MLRPLGQSHDVFAGTGAVVKYEVPCSAGVPDVVFLRLDRRAMKRREGTSSLLDLSDIRVMLQVSQRQRGNPRWWTSSEISSSLSLTVTHLRRTVLPRLEIGGHVEINDRGEVRATYRYTSQASNVVTVEAKLRDWRGAIGQASRHAAVADSAWVAIDNVSSGRAFENRKWFQAYGIGLASVSRDGDVRALIAPSPGQVRRAERELLVERAIALHLAGKVCGEVHQVFGNYLWSSTGDDPRLVDA